VVGSSKTYHSVVVHVYRRPIAFIPDFAVLASRDRLAGNSEGNLVSVRGTGQTFPRPRAAAGFL